MVLLWLDLHAQIINHLLKEQTILLSHPDGPFKIDSLKTHCIVMQIKLNKVQNLEKFIAGNEPDLILISETLPEII